MNLTVFPEHRSESIELKTQRMLPFYACNRMSASINFEMFDISHWLAAVSAIFPKDGNG
jgi:hypothetical protein